MITTIISTYYIVDQSILFCASFHVIFIVIDIFYPSGEPISQHRLRCSSFAVVHYSFMSHFLAATITSVRE